MLSKPHHTNQKSKLPQLIPELCEREYCKFAGCLKQHYRGSRHACLNGGNCFNLSCTFDHCTESNPHFWSVAQRQAISKQQLSLIPPLVDRPSGSSQPEERSKVSSSGMKPSPSAETLEKLPKLISTPCKKGDDCRDTECIYFHKHRPKCLHAEKCWKNTCTFDHSSFTNPSTLNSRQQKLLKWKMHLFKQNSLFAGGDCGSSSDEEEDDNRSTSSVGSTAHFDVDTEFSEKSDSISEVFDLDDRDPLLDFSQLQETFILDTLQKQAPSLSKKQLEEYANKVQLSISEHFMERQEGIMKKMLENTRTLGFGEEYMAIRKALMEEKNLLHKQKKSFDCRMRELEEKRAYCSNYSLLYQAYEREFKRAKALLPFYGFRDEILQAIADNDIVLIQGQTGSGKSTQIPQFLLESGYFGRKIACTQPRRVATTTLADRISDEMNCNGTPLIAAKGARNYQHGGKTKLILLTDRSLLNEFCKDRNLKKYGCIMIDEAHERTVFTDILLAELKALVKRRRESGAPLKLIISSATMDEDLFSSYFEKCPVIKVPGQMYPVKVHWEKSQSNYVNQAVNKVLYILLNHRQVKSDALKGSILVFLTNPEEIEQACKKLKHALKAKHNDYEILPLHGKLSPEAQQQVLRESTKVKIIFASNIAETSVTIKGLTTVIDTGRVKERSFDQNRNISLLKVNFISQSSSLQRKGRAGRTQQGECFNLYDYSEFLQFNISQPADIFKTHLGTVILQILTCHSKFHSNDLIHYDLIEKPSPSALNSQLNKLLALGFVKAESGNFISITEDGKYASQLFMDPYASRMIIEGVKSGISKEIIGVASMMSVSGMIFLKGTDTKSKENVLTSKVSLSKSEGDLYSLYSLYKQFSTLKPVKVQKEWCSQNSLNWVAFKIAESTFKELSRNVKSCNITSLPPNVSLNDDQKKQFILKCIISGFNANIAYYDGTRKDRSLIYKLIELNQEACLHPSSVVFSEDKPPEFILFYELVRTEKLYVKNVTPVDIDTICQYNKTLDKTKIVRQVKKFVEKQIPKACIDVLQSREGEMLEDLERATGCVIEIDETTNCLKYEVSQEQEAASMKIVNEIVKKACHKVEKHLFEFVPSKQNTVRVVIGSGLEVFHVLTKHQYIRLNFRTTTIADSSLRQQFERFGEIWDFEIYPNRTSQQKIEGYVIYTKWEHAEAAFEQLKDLNNDLQLFPTSTCGAASLIDEVPSLIATWYLSHSKGTARIQFPNSFLLREAKKALKVPGALPMLARIEKNETKQNEIELSNLGREMDEEKLRQLFGRYGIYPSKVDVSRDEIDPNSYTEQTQVQTVLVQSLFTQYGNLDFVDIFPPKPAKKNCKVLVKYNSQTSASEALQQLNGSPFGCGKLSISYNVHEKIYLPLAVFEIFKNDIYNSIHIVQTQFHCKAVFKRMKHDKKKNSSEFGNTGFVQVFANNDMKQFEKAKAFLRTSLQCTTLSLSFVQFKDFEKKKEKFKNELKDKVYLSADARTKQVKIYGKEQDREQVKQDIMQAIKNDSKRYISVKSLKKVVPMLSQLKKDFKGDIYMDDIRSKKLIIISTDTEYEKLKQRIQQIENDGNETSCEHECSICCSEIEQGQTLVCGHPFCVTCFAIQLDGFDIESKSIICNECNCKVPVLEILSTYKNNVHLFKEKCEILLNKYLLMNKLKWQYCDVCNQLCRMITPSSYECLNCDMVYCVKCKKRSHEGVSCDHEENLFQQYLASFTKKCPKCTSPIEKNGGCNHMTCSSCNNHFCWLCGYSATSASPIYMHQSSCPGDKTF
ncbi:hypothetical protein C9374_012282 [Naegleria lovaniensis]|uniref:Uncharacterized protein n=1 Tax=Naegleria lovaniensis TaxID=51637 RepID=A0AA88KCH7_NAELO|nr:uncharacterized protein C9374_012282 [Naegleria lovaniensis]KAG2373293.1 hypothetical protein C9374_012282 [Naegleria lovaniensis]